jgi:hypothetical protein
LPAGCRQEQPSSRLGIAFWTHLWFYRFFVDPTSPSPPFLIIISMQQLIFTPCALPSALGALLLLALDSTFGNPHSEIRNWNGQLFYG